MRARRLVNTLSVTPIAEMRKMGVRATWMRWAMSTDWTVAVVNPPMPFIAASTRKRPGRRLAVGALYQSTYLVVAGAAAAFFFFLLCFLGGFGAFRAGGA